MFDLPASSKLKYLSLWLWKFPQIYFDAFQRATSTRSTLSIIQRSSMYGPSVVASPKPKKCKSCIHVSRKNLILSWYGKIAQTYYSQFSESSCHNTSRRLLNRAETNFMRRISVSHVFFIDRRLICFKDQSEQQLNYYWYQYVKTVSQMWIPYRQGFPR